MDKKKILIIDDDPDVHSILKTAFDRAGYQVFSALDAMQGPMMARQLHPDAIVLDIMMPAGGGFGVYSFLKQNTNTFQIPILVYTAVPEEQVREKIPASDHVPVVVKTSPLEKLLFEVQRLIVPKI